MTTTARLRRVLGATILTTHTPAHPMDTMARAGSWGAPSSAPALGITGMGDAVGTDAAAGDVAGTAIAGGMDTVGVMGTAAVLDTAAAKDSAVVKASVVVKAFMAVSAMPALDADLQAETTVP